MSTHGQLWVGTSGWNYRHWRSLFYPELDRWREQAPETFCSAVKATGHDVFTCFNNDMEAHAVRNARTLRHYLKLKNPNTKGVGGDLCKKSHHEP
jgi:uncharacterized protein YecE (DUF72 family)